MPKNQIKDMPFQCGLVCFSILIMHCFGSTKAAYIEVLHLEYFLQLLFLLIT